VAVAGFLALAVLAACDPAPRTEVLASINADGEVRTRIRTLRIEVFGGTAMDMIPVEIAEPGLELFPPGWPVTHAIVPRGNDGTRRYRIEATALDATGTAFAHTRAIAGFVQGQTLSIEMHLYDDCIDHPADQCDFDQRCASGGTCHPAEHELLPLDGGSADAGPTPDGGPPGDGGGLCDGVADGETCGAFGTCCGGACVNTANDPAHCGGCGMTCALACVSGSCAACTGAPDCDDGHDCTTDICEMGGTCTHIPNDGMCSTTMDCTIPRCVVGMGCILDLASNGTPCPGGVCGCGACYTETECGRCAGGACECLENDCETPACQSQGWCM
jgi:hypothetical protein